MPIVKPQAFADLFAMVRAGNAWRFDAAGALAQVGANLPRVDYDPATLAARGLLVEAAATNQVPNPAFEGAAPGVFPAGMSATGALSGVAHTVVGSGLDAGIPYLDIDLVGTATATTINPIIFFAANTVPAATGQSWQASLYARIISGGALPGVATVNAILREALNSTSLAQTLSSAFLIGAGSLASGPVEMSRVFNQPTTNNVQLLFQIRANVTGHTYNHRLRIGVPQLWLSPIAFSPSFPPAGAPGPSSRAADDLDAIDLPRYLNPGAGTFVVQFTPGQPTAATHRGIVTVDDGTGANEFRLRMLPGATTVRLSVDIAGAEVLGIEQASGAALVRHTARVSYGPAGWLLSVNGAAPISAAGPIPAGLVRALLGRGLAAGEYLNGWLGPRFEYYPVQYTDTAAADGFTIRTR
jgi:hypothetical protein